MIYTGDCLDIMPTLPADSVDSIVTDPPYGLSFMGKDWDHGIPGVQFWREALRVAKPGAFLLAFGGTRTFHRLAVAIEDAGWEIRDTVMWVYGSGFPKSLDVGKAIDKAAGAERTEVIGRQTSGKILRANGQNERPYQDGIERFELNITAPATPEAKAWDGWGTALKPAWEPIIVARKPLIGTVAENVLRYGTGAINVDGSRVGTALPAVTYSQPVMSGGRYGTTDDKRTTTTTPPARWPANLIHDGSDEVTAGFPQHAEGKDGFRHSATTIYGSKGKATEYNGDSRSTYGSAARFFYCAKASRSDREGSTHPTMKPTALMRYLVKLVTRRGGVVLDPFMGSGSTGKACAHEGMEFIGIDLSPEYCEIAARRIAAVVQPALTG